MYLKSLNLHNFRRFKTLDLTFHEPISLLIEKNGQGKTTVLEAIYLLARAKSFRAKKVEEMILFERDLSRIKTSLTNAEEVELELILTKGIVQNKKTQKIHFLVNTVKKRKKDFLNHFNCVAFRPEDMRLIEGSPARRRDFIDDILSVCDQFYQDAYKTYYQALLRRNRLLHEIKQGKLKTSVLTYYNFALLKNGQILQEKRAQFFGEFATVDFPIAFQIEYLPSLINEERMKKYQEKELAAGYSLIGPHKDDFLVKIKLKNGQFYDLAAYGSRGQQRLAVLWLKIVEIVYLERKNQDKPILLLDDIFSELDDDSKIKVLELMNRYQTIVTSTEERTEKFLTKNYLNFEIISLVTTV